MVLGNASSTVQVAAGSTFTANGAISGTGSLTKTGAGTVVLGAGNSFSGSTRVTAGNVVAAAASGSALGGTSSITLETGTSLALGASDQINNTAAFNLGGGTFSKGNFSEGSATAVGIGSLNLTADSKIDFGVGTTGTLAFAIFNPGVSFLTIDNWSGTPSTIGDATTDRLVFNSDPTANLLQFVFTGYEGVAAFNLGGGFFEVTPLAPVPEINPALVASAFCLGVGVFIHRRAVRHRARKS